MTKLQGILLHYNSASLRWCRIRHQYCRPVKVRLIQPHLVKIVAKVVTYGEVVTIYCSGPPDALQRRFQDDE